MGKISEPEGGMQDTTIKSLNSSGNYWPTNLEHNGNIYTIPKEGLKIHINGGSVRIHGIDVTRKVQKGVENIFQHSMKTGDMEKITPKDGDNTLPPPVV